MEVLNNLLVRHPVECLGHINEGKDDSMRVRTIKIEMNEVEQLNEVVGNGRFPEATTLPRDKKRINYK